MKKYSIEKRLIKPYFFGETKEFWCIVKKYQEQLYHYYHGYRYIDREDIVFKSLTFQECVAKLKELRGD